MEKIKQKKNIFVAVLFLASFFSLVFFVSQARATASGRLLISWTPPTTNADGSTLTDLAGFIVYYDTAPHTGSCPTTYGSASPYSSSVNVADPDATSASISGLTEAQTYYFAVVAYDDDHSLSSCATVTSGGATEVSKKARFQSDINWDARVNLGDFSILHDHFGLNSGATQADGDINGDGAVGMGDFSLLHSEYSQSSQ